MSQMPKKNSLRFILGGATLATVLAALTAQNALAQQPSKPNAEDSEDSWRFSAGLGLFNRPKYPGSGETQFVPVPLITANYGRYFIGGTPGAGFPIGVGVNLIQNETWRFGVALGGETSKPRKASDAPILDGWGDISNTALGSVFASYTHDWLILRGFLVSDIGGNHEGTRIALDAEGRYRVNDRLFLSAGPGITWANSSYNQTFFGINAEQSVISGLPQYHAGSGLHTVRFSVGAVYRLDTQWSLGANVTTAWLRGDAEGSPITEQRTQNRYGVFASYRF